MDRPRGCSFGTMLARFSLVVTALVCGACSTPSTVTRGEVLSIAHSYTQVEWLPEARHVMHGIDQEGIEVHTPDASLIDYGDRRGWWRPGKPAKGMPYQWGGFDTPETFLTALAAGKKAGDTATPTKRRLLEAGVSDEACGIDCSGFVSRCWKLSRPYSTRTLHLICDRLETWDDLAPGDILLNDKHVVLFAKWSQDKSRVVAYDVGPYPVWKASSFGMPKTLMIEDGYTPWRYRGIRDDSHPTTRLSPPQPRDAHGP